MADNVNVTPGAGATVAADDIAGVKYQRVKIAIGADGVNDGDASAATPLPTDAYVDETDNYSPSIPYTFVARRRLSTDPDGQLLIRGDVLTDEGTFRDNFPGSSLNLDLWTSAISGTASISVANSLVSLVSGTGSGAEASIFSAGDYGPISMRAQLSISQRIANQTIEVGFKDDITSPVSSAFFQFTGTDNTKVTCVSSEGSTASDQQTTTVTIPNATSATAASYYIEVQPDQVAFLINDQIVAIHKTHLPGPYDVVNTVARIVNAAAVTTTTLAIDYVYFINQNSLQINNSFQGDEVPVRVKNNYVQTYSAAITGLAVANNATDIFTITGSATKTVRIKHISMDGTQTTAGNINVQLIKRSTANSAGTSTVPTAVSFDSVNAAATATVRAYTANPTLGTTVGTIHSEKLFVPTTTTVGDELKFDWSYEDGTQLPTLRGTGEVLAINLNATTVSGNNFNIDIIWTEE
jgi:hypothetical protein